VKKVYLLLMVLAVVMVSSLAYCTEQVAPNANWMNTLMPKGTKGPAIMLAENGKTAYTILLPASPTTMETKAAQELAFWLKEMTGTDFTIAKETKGYKAPDYVISIGKTQYAKNHKARSSKLSADGYAIDMTGQSLMISGGNRRGVIDGVYCLLEEDLGCRWYESGTQTIPKSPTLKLRPTPRVFVPVLEDRRDPYYSETWDADWSLRNKTFGLHSFVPDEYGGYPKAMPTFAHTMQLFLPPEEYFSKHPEYYGEIFGVRRPDQLCLSNPDVLKIVEDKITKYLKETPGVKIIDISHNDTGGYCECEKCSVIDIPEGSKMASLLVFINKIAAKFQKQYPDLVFTTLAYGGTVKPPKTIRPAKNVMITLCTDLHWNYVCMPIWDTKQFDDYMKGWHKLGARFTIWDYPIYYTKFLMPVLNMERMCADNQYYVENGATGIMQEAANTTSYGVDRGIMRGWVLAKQMWDPSLDVSNLIRDFTYGYYGPAAEPMMAYQDMMSGLEYNYYKEHRWLTNIEELYTDSFINKSWGILLSARTKAKGDPEVTRRVEVSMLSTMYLILRRGPHGMSKTDYLAMIDDFERIAKGHSVGYVENGLAGQDINAVLAKWRSMTNSDPSRINYLELNNTWKFKTDPDNKGMNEKWYSESLDDTAWASVRSDMDCGWESQGFLDYHGYGWYRQVLNVGEEMLKIPGLNIFFPGVDEEGEVFINGVYAYEQTVKSTGLSIDVLWNKPFMFDVAKYLKPGKNVLAVRVHDVMRQAGIYKPVYLVWGEDLDVDSLENLILMKKGK